jgi:hypothetical protein
MHSPFAHEGDPLLQEVTAPIRCLNPVADRMREGHLRNLPRIVGLFGSPIAKAASKSVDRYVGYPHPTKHRRHRHVRQCCTGSAAGEDVVTAAVTRLLSNYLKRPAGKRHTMNFACLDPLARHRPESPIQIELLPGGARGFARPGTGQHGELQASRCDAFFFAQLRHEGCHTTVIESGMVLDPRRPWLFGQPVLQKALPPGRVLASP